MAHLSGRRADVERPPPSACALHRMVGDLDRDRPPNPMSPEFLAAVRGRLDAAARPTRPPRRTACGGPAGEALPVGRPRGR